MNIETDSGITRPEHLKKIILGMSNFDHKIDDGLAKALQSRNVFCNHWAWNFMGYVWWSGGKFHEEVWVHHVRQETISADTLEELMKSVNDKYGWE